MSAETEGQTVEYKPDVANAALMRAMATGGISSSEYSMEDGTTDGRAESVLALWHSIRDSGTVNPDYHQVSSSRLTPEERQEIWQMCLKRFLPQSGILPTEPVVLYWRLGRGSGSWIVTMATGNRGASGRFLMNFDSLIFTASEWEKADFNPFSLLLSGAFDLVERVGISAGHPTIPLSVHELREVSMATEGATPLPSVGKGYHVEYPERSLGILRQWYSWLSKVERKRYFFASWWSGTALEPTPTDTFLITFTDRKVVTISESTDDFARRIAANLSKAIAALPVESNIRYPALGYAIGEMGTATNLLTLSENPPAGWQGEDPWVLKRQAFTALRNAQTHAETYVKARGDSGELESVLKDIGALYTTLANDLQNEPPPVPVAPPMPAPVAEAPAPATPIESVPTPVYTNGRATPSVQESETIAAPFGKPGRSNGFTGPRILGEAPAPHRQLDQNFPQSLNAAPHRSSKMGMVFIGVLVVLIALILFSFNKPEWFGQTANGKNQVGRNERAGGVQAATPGTALTVELNTSGAIWTGAITATNPKDVALLKSLQPGTRIQTWNDLNQKVFLTIGAKPLVKDNIAKFGAIYRFHPDAQSPAAGTEVNIVARKSDPYTQTIATRPTVRAADRFANQVAIYLSKGLRSSDITGFDPQVVTLARKLQQQTLAKVRK